MNRFHHHSHALPGCLPACFLLLCGFLTHGASGGPSSMTSLAAWSSARAGVRAYVWAGWSGGQWNVQISYQGQGVSYPEHSWLLLTNRVGARLHLQTSDGKVIEPTHSDVLSVRDLPGRIPISELFDGFQPKTRRGMLWLGIEPDSLTGAISFTLMQDLYTVSRGGSGIPPLREEYRTPPAFEGFVPSNKYVLKVTPLLYKVLQDGATAELVEFPTVELRLPALRQGNSDSTQERGTSTAIHGVDPSTSASSSTVAEPAGRSEGVRVWRYWAAGILIGGLAFLGLRLWRSR